MIEIRKAERLGRSGVGERRVPKMVVGKMAQFAEVLSQVSTEQDPASAAAPGVRVNTAGWDSWLKTAPDSPPPAPASLYLHDDLADEDVGAREVPAGTPPQREEIPRSSYAGPAAGAPETGQKPSQQARPLDLGAELARQRLERLNEAQLRALRRRLARRVHPDLPEAEAASAAAMAQVNVAIDAALRDRRPKHPRS